MPRLARLDAPGVIHHVIMGGIERRKIFRNNKDRNDTRGLFCYWAVRELGYGQAELGRRLGMTQPGVGYAVQRGEHIVKENNFLIGK